MGTGPSTDAPSSRGRSFGFLLAGQSISALGDAFANVAMPLLVLASTGSATQMGIVAGLSMVAQLVGGVLAGPIVDQVDRRRLLMACDWAQFALAGSVPLVWWVVPAPVWDRYGIWLIYAVVVASSIAVSLSTVGLRAIMPQIVGRDRLVRANGQLITLGEVAYGVGPALAGVVIAATSEAGAIGINALTFGVSALAWAFVRPRIAARITAGAVDEATSVPLAGRLAGLRFVLAHPFLRHLVALELVNGMLIAGTTMLFIYYLRTDLGVGSGQIGLLLSLASVGAVLAAVSTGALRRLLGVGRAWLLSVAVQGVALAAVSLGGSVWVVAPLAVVFAFGQVVAAILGTTLRQEITPDPLLGRVSAAVLTVFLATEALGIVLVSAAADLFATTTVFVVIGSLNLLVVLVGLGTPLWRTRSIRQEAS
ncbi:MFS transporter [Micromonospora marina]|uniref:Transmembrane secretion effector n=1 Tax=Micromonospora marina TaxID=307120 RepID=A0A1C5AJW8_9ACTN|nr:MFS transporter [Micromonospora marina]SCF45396.1 Transmembrane secretion effector [Micromonospora marina]